MFERDWNRDFLRDAFTMRQRREARTDEEETQSNGGAIARAKKGPRDGGAQSPIEKEDDAKDAP